MGASNKDVRFRMCRFCHPTSLPALLTFSSSSLQTLCSRQVRKGRHVCRINYFTHHPLLHRRVNLDLQLDKSRWQSTLCRFSRQIKWFNRNTLARRGADRYSASTELKNMLPIVNFSTNGTERGFWTQ